MMATPTLTDSAPNEAIAALDAKQADTAFMKNLRDSRAEGHATAKAEWNELLFRAYPSDKPAAAQLPTLPGVPPVETDAPEALTPEQRAAWQESEQALQSEHGSEWRERLAEAKDVSRQILGEQAGPFLQELGLGNSVGLVRDLVEIAETEKRGVPAVGMVREIIGRIGMGKEGALLELHRFESDPKRMDVLLDHWHPGHELAKIEHRVLNTLAYGYGAAR